MSFSRKVVPPIQQAGINCQFHTEDLHSYNQMCLCQIAMINSKPDTHVPFIIEKFTMAFDLVEDRIRMNAFNANDGVQAIWLTRRLLDRFLPIIVRKIEEKVGSSMVAQFGLSVSQQKLRDEREISGAEPVIAPADSLPWLSNKMKLVPHGEGFVWVLQGTTGCEARFFLTDENLRSTLDILHISYSKMEWHSDNFPNWVVDFSRDKQTRALH